MSSKIKVSFEITDIYNLGDFRAFIKFLLSNDTKYDVLIISNNDSSSYIHAVGEQLGIELSNRIICNFNADKLQAITDNNINIHLDGIFSFVTSVENETEAYGILVDSKVDKYGVKQRYVEIFQRIESEITRDQNEA